MYIFPLLTLLLLAASSTTETKYNPLFNKKGPTAYPCPGKMVKDMNQEELEKVLEYAKTNNDSELAFKAFYHVINITQDHAKIKVYKLDLADFCFSLEDYAKAAMKYEEFCILYPGALEAEYAQYKLILCTFYISLVADRDQSDTLKTINLISLFLKKAKEPKFINEMESIYKSCRERLFEHEVFVFETYLKQQKFTGAQKRIEFMQKNFQDVPNQEKYVVYLQDLFETIKNPKTRPFVFKINLKDALSPKKQDKKQNKATSSDIGKAVSYFVA
jgi:outer membrane assembly lipoprotein YfiO